MLIKSWLLLGLFLLYLVLEIKIMRKSSFVLILAAIATGMALSLLGPGVGAGVEGAKATPVDPAQAVTLGVARYLDEAPAVSLQTLGVRASEPAREIEPTSPDATQAGQDRLAQLESRISAHYPESVTGDLIRHYAALCLAEVDTDFRPDLSRQRLMNEIMKNPTSAAQDLKASLGMIPLENEVERSALLKLAEHIGTSEEVLPMVESILVSEMQRKGFPSNDALAEARFAQLVDSYTLLVQDVGKQAQFVRSGLDSQEHSGIRQVLQNRLDVLTRMAPSAGLVSDPS